MSEAPTTDTRSEVLARAARELHSARLLVAEVLAGPDAAAPHLCELWRCLAWLSHGEVPDEPGESLANWLAPGDLAHLPEPTRATLHAMLVDAFAHGDATRPWSNTGQTSELPPLPKPRQLLRQLAALDRLLAVLANDEAHAARTRLRWLARGLATLTLLAALVALVWRPWQGEPDGPWRAAFYPSKSFDGEPDRTRVTDVAFDWVEEPPTESIPDDFYSARFDTCLVLDEASEVAFMLVSDNGSRLFVDGELRIDNWAKRRGPSVMGEHVQLDPGTHHLRVDYFEDRNEAQLHLSASFDPAETPGPIPAGMLRYPSQAVDAPSPCAD